MFSKSSSLQCVLEPFPVWVRQETGPGTQFKRAQLGNASTSFGYTCPSRVIRKVIWGKKEKSQTHFFQTCFCRRASDRKLRQDVWSILGPQTLPKTCSKKLILGMWTWTISSLSQTGEWSRCTIPESPIWQCINFIRIHLSIPNSPGIYLVRKTLYKTQTHFSKNVFDGPLTENVGKMFGVYLVHRSCPRALSQKAYLLNVYRRHSQATEFIYFNVTIKTK